MSARREATLYVDAVRAAKWLLENVPESSPIGARIHTHAARLCEEIALALGPGPPAARLAASDEALVRLRTAIRLAHESGRLEESGFLHVSGELEGVGRQIGGWTRRLAEPKASS